MFSRFRKKRPERVEEVRIRVLDSDLYQAQHTPALRSTFATKQEARRAVRDAGLDPRDFLYAPVACRVPA
jgi:hypothetical protein